MSATEQNNSFNESKVKNQMPYVLKPGQKVFEMDTITGNVAPAKYKKLDRVHSVLIERKDCIYIPAHDLTHAIKRIKFLLGSQDRDLAEMLNKVYSVVFPFWEPFDENDYIGPYLHNHAIAYDEQIKHYFINSVSKFSYAQRP